MLTTLFSHDQLVCPASPRKKLMLNGVIRLQLVAPLGPLHPVSTLGLMLAWEERKKKMYQIAEVFEAGKAQDVIKSEPKEYLMIDENGQLFRGETIDEDE